MLKLIGTESAAWTVQPVARELYQVAAMCLKLQTHETVSRILVKYIESAEVPEALSAVSHFIARS